MYDYDVISIGAGSGGCSSAMRSADLGKKVAIVEYRQKDGVGGTCVNRGCIPTKALVKSAETYTAVASAAKFGIQVDGFRADQKAIHAKKNAAINSLRFGLTNVLIKPRKIDILNGKARFLDEHTLELTDPKGEVRTVTAENFVIAVGSEPAMIPAFHINGTTIITSNEALNLPEIPESMTIIGAGALGLEFAYVFSSFGCKVTVVEMMPHVVPAMKDEEITGQVSAYLKKQGVEIRTGNKIEEVTERDGMTVARLGDGEEVVSAMTLVAIGRKLNTGDLNLKAAGVKTTERGQIITDAHMRTSVPHIYAAGDITVGPQLSHKAQRQGVVAAENIAGMDSQIRYDVIPWAIFMNPEIAGVGLTQAEAEEQGIETTVGRMPFSANEKAMCMQSTTGMIKIVARKADGVVVGGQIFGVDASVLISEIALAVQKGITIDDIATMIHAHPTLAEIVMECSKNGLGKAFHK